MDYCVCCKPDCLYEATKYCTAIVWYKSQVEDGVAYPAVGSCIPCCQRPPKHLQARLCLPESAGAYTPWPCVARRMQSCAQAAKPGWPGPLRCLAQPPQHTAAEPATLFLHSPHTLLKDMLCSTVTPAISEAGLWTPLSALLCTQLLLSCGQPCHSSSGPCAMQRWLCKCQERGEGHDALKPDLCQPAMQGTQAFVFLCGLCANFIACSGYGKDHVAQPAASGPCKPAEAKWLPLKIPEDNSIRDWSDAEDAWQH